MKHRTGYARSLGLGLLACACTVTNVPADPTTSTTGDATAAETGTTTEPTADGTAATATDPSGTKGYDSTGTEDSSTTEADSSSGGTEITSIAGAFQKGPMLIGSTVLVATMLPNGMPTGSVYLTDTIDDTGAFMIDIPGPGTAARFKATGFFYDEVEAELSPAAITLQGLMPLAGGQVEGWINVLTHLQAERAIVLVEGGASFPDALAQSAQETVNALQIGAGVVPGVPFTELAILGDGSIDDAYLLAVSAVLLEAARRTPGPPSAAVQQLLNNLSAELADDGTLAPERIAQLDAAERFLDSGAVLANLTDWATTIGASWVVPDLDAVIDNDQDGIANAFDNCPFVPNPGQEDGDINGEGDACHGACPDRILLWTEIPWRGNMKFASPIDEYTGSCGEPQHEFTTIVQAPADGTYTFQITDIGAHYPDLHLYALDGPCASGAEIACNDALVGAPPGQAGLELDLLTGQVVTVVVDGASLTPGTQPKLTIARVGECPDLDLGVTPTPFTVLGSTVGEGTMGGGSCGGLGSDDFAYTWVAPESTLYRFDATGSSFDAIVHVRDGASCDGTELACGHGTTTTELVAGQEVTLVVSGDDTVFGPPTFPNGDFELTVATNCPKADLGEVVPQMIAGTAYDSVDQFNPSCSLSAVVRDDAYLFTAPADGTYRFETTYSLFPSLVCALDGICAGPELGCTDEPAGNLAALEIPMTMGQTITLVIQSTTNLQPTSVYDLEVSML